MGPREGAGRLRFVARIVRTATGTVTWQSAPTSERMARRIADGALVNLERDEYHPAVVDLDESPGLGLFPHPAYNNGGVCRPGCRGESHDMGLS